MMKDLVMKVTKEVTNELPDNASAAEILDAIIVKISAMKGFKDIEEGRFTTQEDLLEEIKQWV